MSALLRISTLVPVFMSNPWEPTKRQAVQQIVSWRLSRNVAKGKGNRAAKRAALFETQRWSDGLTEAEVNQLAEDVAMNTRKECYHDA